MKINYTPLNNSLDINKRQIQMSIAPKTTKEDKEYQNRIDPIVSVTISQNLILQNNRLDKAIRILAQNVILNEITYLSDKESDIEETLLVFGKIILTNYINKFKNSILMDSVLLKSYSMKKQNFQKNYSKYLLKRYSLNRNPTEMVLIVIMLTYTMDKATKNQTDRKKCFIQ
jgi:hypothetical protein